MLFALALAALVQVPPAPRSTTDTVTWVRINQVGYLPDAPKVAVACSLDSVHLASFIVQDERGRTVLGPRRAERAKGFGPCVVTHRLDFSALKKPGRYRIVAGEARSPAMSGPSGAAAGAVSPNIHARSARAAEVSSRAPAPSSGFATNTLATGRPHASHHAP